VTDEVLAPAARSLLFSVAAVALAAIPGLPLAALVGLSRTRAARWGRVAARIGMAIPTVAAGLIVYSLVSRYGPLGGLGLLYTPGAIVMGEFLLAFPMIVALGAAAVDGVDPRFRETAAALQVPRGRLARLALGEARDGVLAALLAAFARCVTELGVALLVGGNLAGAGLLRSTRTLTTAIATETSRGDFRQALWLGGVLVAVAIAVNLAADAVARQRARS
jgi:tungstate transport system permease protein